VSDQSTQRGGRNQFILDAFGLQPVLVSHSGLRADGRQNKTSAAEAAASSYVSTPDMSFAPSFERWLGDVGGQPFQRDPVDDLALIPGTGGTTGQPKGVMLSGRNIETMTALTLMGYPFKGRPTYLALAPADACCGVLCFPS